jgi:hypothetical protein
MQVRCAALKSLMQNRGNYLADAPKVVSAFSSSPLAREMGVRYPLIQGAMTYITDNPDFAKRIAEAGGLATIALGMMDEDDLEKRLGNLSLIMGDFPYAVNIITLNENPCREVQLAWIKRTRPRFAVIAAGEPSHAASLISSGIETIYIAPNGLLKSCIKNWRQALSPPACPLRVLSLTLSRGEAGL